MKCPYCGKEMDKGFFTHQNGIIHGLQKEKSLIIGEISQKNMKLFKKGWANTLQITVFRCANCKVMIINEDDC